MEFPKVISVKVSLQHYDVCRNIAIELWKTGAIAKPTVSELLRLMISKLEEKTSTIDGQSGNLFAPGIDYNSGCKV
jgi:hypothetical protein